MQNDDVYLLDLWRVFRREWKWFVALFTIVLAVAIAYAMLVEPQWEATAWIQIGQVGNAPAGMDVKVEAMPRVIDRMKFIPFQNGVTKSVGLGIDSPAARLYRKSLKLEPLYYDGQMIKLSVRATSPQLAVQLATASVTQLQAVHQPLEFVTLKLLHDRLDEIQHELDNALTERERLRAAVASKQADGGSNAQSPLLATVLLADKNEEVQQLQQGRGDVLNRLGPLYTYATSLAWPVYVPNQHAFPNVTLIVGGGLLAGLFFGLLAALTRQALRDKP